MGHPHAQGRSSGVTAAGVVDQVSLREVVPADLPILHYHQLDREACRVAGAVSRDWRPFLKDWSAVIVGESGVVARSVTERGTVAGYVVSYSQGEERRIGYWLGRQFWGRGIAKRALTQFLELVEERPLVARVAEHNQRSIQVLERCGFQRSDCSQPALSVPGSIQSPDGVDELIFVLGDDR